MSVPGVHSQPTQHDLHITGLISLRCASTLISSICTHFKYLKNTVSDRLPVYFVYLSLWMYLWLAETSHQPISKQLAEGHPPL